MGFPAVKMMTRKGQDLLSLAALMTMLTLAGLLALSRIRVSQRTIDPAIDSSPLGYTFSLALFLLPCAVFGIWLWRSPRTEEQRRACFITLLLLIPLGFILDLLFGRTFLKFPNAKATLGILIPGYELSSGLGGLFGPGWEPFLPVEEFAFYLLGFTAILFTYTWADAILFPANKIDERQRTPRVFKDWINTLFFWLIVGLVLFGVAWLIRRAVPSQSGSAFPGYFLFLLLGSIVPSLFCSRVAFQFINWRAFTISWLFVLAISQFWEASLGIPYGWWGYEPDQMLGLFLKAHCDLPIEAAIVWTLTSWTTVIIYETLLTAIYAGRKGWNMVGVMRAPESELESVKQKQMSTRKIS
ncbi:MAG: hypothetical protein L0Z50_26985 [Verrucomicrobiales bacterium]|nr:hypothetical protein [Verrucomicrobiales bacterium]